MPHPLQRKSLSALCDLFGKLLDATNINLDKRPSLELQQFKNKRLITTIEGLFRNEIVDIKPLFGGTCLKSPWGPLGSPLRISLFFVSVEDYDRFTISYFPLSTNSVSESQSTVTSLVWRATDAWHSLFSRFHSIHVFVFCWDLLSFLHFLFLSEMWIEVRFWLGQHRNTVI